MLAVIRGALWYDSRAAVRSAARSSLHRVFTRVELTVARHERPKDLWRELAQQVLDSGGFRPQKSGGASITRRTSMGTLTKSTMREAMAIARASSSTSTIQ